ncbi:hypothetical protein A6R68_24236, partial [Neotoma lepida]
MAYGQTGSGKSYTMVGPYSEGDSALLSGAREDLGIIPRAAEELFRYTLWPVISAVEFVGLIHRGIQLRVQQPTLVHKNSSRSHLIVTATLTTASSSGSTAVSGVTGLALKETSFINRSLAALADVLGALSEHCDHIPYRNSKLTHLLQDS